MKCDKSSQWNASFQWDCISLFVRYSINERLKHDDDDDNDNDDDGDMAMAMATTTL